MSGMTYSVITFGCRVNQADSLGIEEELRRCGAEPAAPEHADVVVVNTCSVTSSADQGARQTIRRIARVNPDVRIVVTGCYATRETEQVRALPNVVRVVPNDDKPKLLTFVRGVRLQPDGLAPDLDAQEPPDPDLSTAERYAGGNGSCGASIEPGAAGRTAFTLRVQTGCGECCSYCIIPTTRGRPRSLPPDAVLREVERLAAAGFKEIALAGVHLGSYGRDLSPRSSLLELLTRLAAVAARGLKGPAYVQNVRGADLSGPPLLFRISSLEPMDCSRDIVELVASGDVFAPHLHLPLQHASSRMLAAMRRPYTLECYSALVASIRERIPMAFIGSDVIAGFPGETDEDFEQLASYLERSPLTHVHVFPYSDRPGTQATAMPGKVPGPVVRERAHRLRAISQQLTERFQRSQLGTVHRALTLEDGSLVVTGNYLKLRIAPGLSRNEWVRVRVASDHHGELLAG